MLTKAFKDPNVKRLGKNACMLHFMMLETIFFTVGVGETVSTKSQFHSLR